MLCAPTYPAIYRVLTVVSGVTESCHVGGGADVPQRYNNTTVSTWPKNEFMSGPSGMCQLPVGRALYSHLCTDINKCTLTDNKARMLLDYFSIKLRICTYLYAMV